MTREEKKVARKADAKEKQKEAWEDLKKAWTQSKDDLKKSRQEFKQIGKEMGTAFKELAEQEAEKSKDKHNVKCPKCKSKNVQFAGNKRKSFSVGKAAVGAVITGGAGTLAGFAGKKGKKNTFICMDCGKSFDLKS